jgi:hypothetical protein
MVPNTYICVCMYVCMHTSAARRRDISAGRLFDEEALVVEDVYMYVYGTEYMHMCMYVCIQLLPGGDVSSAGSLFEEDACTVYGTEYVYVCVCMHFLCCQGARHHQQGVCLKRMHWWLMKDVYMHVYGTCICVCVCMHTSAARRRDIISRASVRRGCIGG